MSKIEAEVKAATGREPKRGETRQEYLDRLVDGIDTLKEKDFDKLSEDAVKWFNDGADAIEAKADIPEFPDLVKDEPAASTSRRRRGGDEPAKEAKEPTKGDEVKIITKRGKEAVGTITEIDDEVICLDTGGKADEEFARDRIESIDILSSSAAADDEPADPFKLGTEVKAVTKRGKEYTGEIVEIDAKLLVIKTKDGEEELDRDRLESVTIVGGSKSEPETGRRRRAGEDEKDTTKDKEPRSASGAGARIRELIVEGYKKAGKAPSVDDLNKVLTKEKLEFKEATLKLVHSQFTSTVDLLDAAGLMKLK